MSKPSKALSASELRFVVTSLPLTQEFAKPLPLALSTDELALLIEHKFHPSECVQGRYFLEQEI